MRMLRDFVVMDEAVDPPAAISQTHLEFTDDTQVMRLDSIKVFPDYRGQGHGSEALRAVKTLADAEDIVLTLHCAVPETEDNAPFTQRQLKKWFGRHGWNFTDANDPWHGVRVPDETSNEAPGA